MGPVIFAVVVIAILAFIFIGSRGRPSPAGVESIVIQFEEELDRLKREGKVSLGQKDPMGVREVLTSDPTLRDAVDAGLFAKRVLAAGVGPYAAPWVDSIRDAVVVMQAR